MIQNSIGAYKNDKEINDKVIEIENCKYCTVKDIRVVRYDSSSYQMKVQIIYDYDIKQYIADTNPAQ